MDRDGVTTIKSGRPSKTEEPSGADTSSDAAGADEAVHFWTDLKIQEPATRLTLQFSGLHEADELTLHGGKIPVPFGVDWQMLFALYFPDKQRFLLQNGREIRRFLNMPEKGAAGLWILNATNDGFDVEDPDRADMPTDVIKLFAEGLELSNQALDDKSGERCAALWITEKSGDGHPVLVSTGITDLVASPAQERVTSPLSNLYQQGAKKEDIALLRDRILVAMEDFSFGVSEPEELAPDLANGKASSKKLSKGRHIQSGEVIPIGDRKRDLHESAWMRASDLSPNLAVEEEASDKKQLEPEPQTFPTSVDEFSDEEPREPVAASEVGSKGFSEELYSASDAGNVSLHALAKALYDHEILRKSKK